MSVLGYVGSPSPRFTLLCLFAVEYGGVLSLPSPR